jgi:hypothetical protein
MFNIIKNIIKLPVDVVKDVVTVGLYNSMKEVNGEKTITPFATLDRLIKIAKDTD